MARVDTEQTLRSITDRAKEITTEQVPGVIATNVQDALSQLGNQIVAAGGPGIVSPVMDGTATVGISSRWAHEDHIHPTDTSLAPIVRPSITGSVTVTTGPSDANGLVIQGHAVGDPNEGSQILLVNNNAATPNKSIRVDSNGNFQIVNNAYTANIINITDAGIATVGATPTAGDNSTKVATTAYTDSAVTVEKNRATTAEALLAPLASPALTGTPTAPLPAIGTDNTQIATTHFITNTAVRTDIGQGLNNGQRQQAQGNVYLPPTMQSFLSGTGTYSRPTGCTWIRVRMVGGGGGGAGGGASNSTGGGGGNTSFGGHTANGGGAAVATGGGVGGSGTIGAGGVGIVVPGNGGGPGAGCNSTAIYLPGGSGGGTIFGGGANCANYLANGTAGVVNTGGGGSGGANSFVAGQQAGGGGGGGGGLDIIISAPVATYSYAVGGGGAAGPSGGSTVPGAGGSGAIYVEEHYGS